MWGTDEEIKVRLKERYDRWAELRGPLMTYGNQHPSDDVRLLVHEAIAAVEADLRLTAWLPIAHRTETTMDSFHESERAHSDAIAATERLMVAIRSY